MIKEIKKKMLYLQTFILIVNMFDFKVDIIHNLISNAYVIVFGNQRFRKKISRVGCPFE